VLRTAGGLTGTRAAGFFKRAAGLALAAAVACCALAVMPVGAAGAMTLAPDSATTYEYTQVFDTAGSCTTWTPPAGVSAVHVEATGQAGQGSSIGAPGGPGDEVVSDITTGVDSADPWKVCVGYGGGSSGEGAGNGGGASVFGLGNQVMVLAGGGGGAGDSMDASGGAAGHPDGANGGGDSDTEGHGGEGNGPGRGGLEDQGNVFLNIPGKTGGPAAPATGGMINVGGAGAPTSDEGSGGGGGAGYGGGGGGGTIYLSNVNGGGGGGTDGCPNESCVVTAGAGTAEGAGTGPGEANVTLSWNVAPTTITVTSPTPNETFNAQDDADAVATYSCGGGGGFSPTTSYCDAYVDYPGDLETGGGGSTGGSIPLSGLGLGPSTLYVSGGGDDGTTDTDDVTFLIAEPPTATLSGVTNGATYYAPVGLDPQASCMEGNYGTGIASCVPSMDADPNGIGSHQDSVTATSEDGLSSATTVSWTVDQSAQSIAFTGPSGGTVFGSDTLSATGGASGDPVVFSSLTPSVCSVSGTNGSTVSYLASGNCTIEADQAGDTDYSQAAPVTWAWQVAAAAQQISFTAPSSGNAGYSVSVYPSGGGSGNAVSVASNSPRVCSTAPNADGSTTLTYLRIGTCNLTLNQAGNTQYAPAHEANAAVQVVGAVLAGTLSAQSLSSSASDVVYQVQFTAADGLLAGTSVVVGHPLATPQGSGMTVWMHAGGVSTPAAASLSGDVTTVTVPAGVSVPPGAVVQIDLTGITNPAGTFGGGWSVFTTADPGLVDLGAVTYHGEQSVSGLTATAVPASASSIAYQASFALTNALFTTDFEGSSLTGVGSGPFGGTSTISATLPAGASVSGCPDTTLVDDSQSGPGGALTCESVTGQSASGLTITWAFTSGTNVPAGDQAALEIPGVTNPASGTRGAVSLSTSADPGVASATFTLDAAQSITFPTVGPLYSGPAAVTLGATASSGLPVSYDVISGPCSVSGSTLHATSVGSCVLAAGQAGSVDYTPAAQATQTIVVKTDAATTCKITSTVAGPPAMQQVTVQNTAGGLSAITNIAIVNGTVSYPSFAPGTTSPVVVTATKTNQALKTSWSFAATDGAGNVTQCA
jgi:trimeric autotransporter adhesin